MRTTSIRILLTILAALVLAGCVTSVVFKEKPRLECPEPPPPVCKPTSFNETTIDTSSSPQTSATHYLTISKVGGLDTRADEYSAAFTHPSGSTALVTRRIDNDDPNKGHDEIATAAFSAVDKAAITGVLEASAIEGSIGGGVVDGRSDSVVFAARPSGSVVGDYDLFSGDLRSNGIDAARRSPLGSEIYWDAQPARAPDGSALYFSSDRKGSSGGTDIFVVRRTDTGWSEPTNVGPAVNTPCDELGPFVSGDGKWLYFSSAGHATVGGYDLFRAAIVNGQLGNAENLGRPINTTADELFPSAPSGANPDTLLYYASNQTGSAGFDIYVLHRMRRRGPAIASTTPRTVTLRGTIRDRLGRPVDSARVSIEQRDPPGNKDSAVTSRDGGYKFNVEEGHRYELLAGSDSTLFVREEVRIPISDGRREVTHDIALADTVTFRVNFPFNNASDPYEFTLDDQGMPSDLRWVDMIDHAAEFLKRFNGAQGLRFEIVGHTDPVGSDQFNLDLGQRRAEFIRRRLVDRGVSAALLTVDSRGESQPLRRADNEQEEQYHARLRRVELIRKK